MTKKQKIDYQEIVKKLKEGDVIKWKSRSYRLVRDSGSCFYDNVLTGLLRGLILPTQKPEEILPWISELTNSQIKFGNGKNGISVNTRIVIEVERTKKRDASKKIKSFFYGITPTSILEINGTKVSELEQ